MGVVGVVLLGVLADVLLPDGQINKYVKGIFTVLLLLVMLAPVGAFFRQQTPSLDLFDWSNTGYQQDNRYIQIVDDDILQSTVCARYPTVYRVQSTAEAVYVYLTGETPDRLVEYVAIVYGVEPQEVYVYAQ